MVSILKALRKRSYCLSILQCFKIFLNYTRYVFVLFQSQVAVAETLLFYTRVFCIYVCDNDQEHLTRLYIIIVHSKATVYLNLSNLHNHSGLLRSNLWSDLRFGENILLTWHPFMFLSLLFYSGFFCVKLLSYSALKYYI